MREKTVEQKLVQAVKAEGGICPKFTSPGFDGMPDRIDVRMLLAVRQGMPARSCF